MTRPTTRLGLWLVVAGAAAVVGCKQGSIAVPASQPDLRGVYAASASAVWAVGEDGTILFYDGETWTEQASQTTLELRAVHGSGPADVWAVGVFAVAVHFDGDQWEPVETPGTPTLEAVWVVAPDDVWATGQGGNVLHYDGTEWVDVEGPGLGWSYGVWGSASDDVWVAGGAGIARYDGTGWTAAGTMPGSHRGLHGAGERVVAVGHDTAMRFDGTEWTTDTLREGVSLLGVWSDAGGEAWAVGYQVGGPMGRGGALFHFDGATWTETHGGREYLRAIHGTGPTDLWAVGSQGRVMSWDGAEWTAVPIEEEPAP